MLHVQVNIDAALVDSGEASLVRSEEKMVQMQNGCICCTLREDLLDQVSSMSHAENASESTVVELAGPPARRGEAFRLFGD